MDVVKLVESGFAVPDICRELGISTATFYEWRAKYCGMDVSMMSRMKELEDENRRLKKMYLEEKLKAEIVAEALEKSGEAISKKVDCHQSGYDQRAAHQGGLRSVADQLILLSLRAPTRCRERRSGQLAHPFDGQPPQLGLWPVLPVPAQRQGLQMESQAGVPNLEGVGAQFADQTSQTLGARES